MEITEKLIHNLELIQTSSTLRFLGIPEGEEENVLRKFNVDIRTKLIIKCQENNFHKVFRLDQISGVRHRVVMVQFIKCFEVITARKLLDESSIVKRLLKKVIN